MLFHEYVIVCCVRYEGLPVGWGCVNRAFGIDLEVCEVVCIITAMHTLLIVPYFVIFTIGSTKNYSGKL